MRPPGVCYPPTWEATLRDPVPRVHLSSLSRKWQGSMGDTQGRGRLEWAWHGLSFPREREKKLLVLFSLLLFLLHKVIVLSAPGVCLAYGAVTVWRSRPDYVCVHICRCMSFLLTWISLLIVPEFCIFKVFRGTWSWAPLSTRTMG